MTGFRYFAGLALLVLAALPHVAFGQETSVKLGYVDSQEIIQQAPGYAEANDTFTQLARSWQDTLDLKRADLEQKFDEYKTQEVILSPEKKTERQQEMLRLEQEAQAYFQARFGPDGDAGTRQAELMRPIIDRVNAAIEQVRQEEGYGLIFDLNGGALVAGDPSLNITMLVVQRLQAQASTQPSR